MTSPKLPLIALLCTLPLAACAATSEALKPYPTAAEGYQRHVIDLPPQANEAEHKVEIIAARPWKWTATNSASVANGRKRPCKAGAIPITNWARSARPSAP